MDSLIKDIGKEGSPIRVQRTSYKNKDYIDVRKMWTTDGGELAPTKKGISIGVDDLFEVVEALVEALEMDQVYELNDVLEKKISLFEEEGGDEEECSSEDELEDRQE